MAASALRPPTYSPERTRLKPRDTLVRAATVELLRRDFGRGEVETAEAVLQRQYCGCMATAAYLQKTATTPAMTTVATWAAELVQTSVIDFMANEMPASAFAQLAARALTVTLEPGAAVKVPSRASPLVLQGAWVGEGEREAGGVHAAQHGERGAVQARRDLDVHGRDAACRR